MPDIEKLGNEAKKTVKRVASDSPLSKPAGMAVAGAALAAIPFAVEKLGSLAGPKISEKASEVGSKATHNSRTPPPTPCRAPRVTRSGGTL